MDQAKALIDFWFGQPDSNPVVAARQSVLWWGKSLANDKRVQQYFGDYPDRALAGEFAHWQETPESFLALIISLDQLPRNLYRNSAQSFAYDAEALRLCKLGLSQRIDEKLSLLERVFFYLPLQHAENDTCQNHSVEKFSRLIPLAKKNEKSLFENYLQYAVAHQQVIKKYGRFPHRNAILQRSSTTEEYAYLAQPGAGF